MLSNALTRDKDKIVKAPPWNPRFFTAPYDYELPLGRVEVLVPGPRCRSDAAHVGHACVPSQDGTLAAPGPTAPLVPKSARQARIELVDLRTMRTSRRYWRSFRVSARRLVIVHEASRTAGVGAEIAAEIQSKAFLISDYKLHAPVRRVTGWE